MSFYLKILIYGKVIEIKRRNINSGKKLMMILIGGLVIMTQITGCMNKPSKKEVVDKFSDFLTMFPSKDMTFLYDKEGDRSNLDEGDLGTWVISSYKYLNDEKGKRKTGVVLPFNRNTKEAKGKLFIEKDEEEKEYSVYYDKEGIHLVDENVDESVKQELDSFKLMYEYISLNRAYLDSLSNSEVYYNGEVPLYDITYKLKEDDENIKKIKEIYPELSIDKDNISLVLEGDGTPWNTTSEMGVIIRVSEEKLYNSLSCSLSFRRSDRFKDFIEGE